MKRSPLKRRSLLKEKRSLLRRRSLLRTSLLTARRNPLKEKTSPLKAKRNPPRRKTNPSPSSPQKPRARAWRSSCAAAWRTTWIASPRSSATPSHNSSACWRASASSWTTSCLSLLFTHRSTRRRWDAVASSSRRTRCRRPSASRWCSRTRRCRTCWPTPRPESRPRQSVALRGGR